MSRANLDSRVNSYSLTVATGTMAAGLAGAAEIMQFFWSATPRAAIVSVVCDGIKALATGFTAGACLFDMTVARSFTVAGTGGAVATISGNNGKHSTLQGTTLLGELRIATTAALTAGTKTLDSQPVSAMRAAVSTGAHEEIILPGQVLFESDPDNGLDPIYLAANEGFVIRATVPATGTWDAGFTVRWIESP